MRESESALTLTDPLTTIRCKERTMAAKNCSACHELKPLSEFSRGGRHAYCKPCDREKARLWRANNRERHRALSLAWARKNKERVKERMRLWVKANMPKLLARNKAWRM